MLLVLALLACKTPDDTDAGEASITADPASVDVGTLLAGETVTAEITLSNAGPGSAAEDLALEGEGASAWSVTPSSVDLAAGDDLVVTVTFAPGAAGDYPARLAVLDLEVPLMGRADEDNDQDGHTSVASGGDDCDDNDAAVYPGAMDEWYDGVDADCAGNDDFDQDGDGYLFGEDDCDDNRNDVNPEAEETWYDDIDQDCAGDDDFDQDGDGHALGPDCDDEDPVVNPDATETWYDGVDQDCSGGSDYDQDDDGYESGDDCDDADDRVNPDAFEVFDLADNDCSGLADDLPVEVAAQGVLLGTSADMALGQRPGLSHGDLDGDGDDDLVIVSPRLDTGYGFVVPAADVVGFNGAITDLATATFTGADGFTASSVVGAMTDLTDDGTDDLLVAGTSAVSGRAWLIAGGSVTGALDLAAADAMIDGGATGERLAYASGGDVNGDGADDLVAGYLQPDKGVVATFFGPITASASSDDADAVVSGETNGDALGTSLAVADVDGDGYFDVLAGAPGRDDMAPDSGGVYLLPGSASPDASTDAETVSPFLLAGQTATTRLGEDPLAVPGDADGDGAADVAAGSEALGTVWVWLDAPSLTGLLPIGSANHEIAGSAGAFGGSAAFVDLDADAVDEVILGADSSNTYGMGAGELFVFRDASAWGAKMSSGDASATVWGATGDHVGTDAHGGFDADADGKDDLLVGATLVDAGAADAGAVYLLTGW
jgi:hypothetical protein